MHFEWVFIAFGKYSVMFFGCESLWIAYSKSQNTATPWQMLVVDWIYPLYYIRNVKLVSSLYPQVSGHSCAPFYPGRSCKFTVTCTASPKGPQHDLCTPLYVADDRKRKRKTNKPVEKTMQCKKKGKERGCEWGDRIVFKYIGYYICHSLRQALCLCTCVTPTSKKRSVLHGIWLTLVSPELSFLQQGDMWLCFSPRSFLLWVTTWLIISLSCFTYRHTSAWLGLSRTEARLNGFGNCLLIHLNRFHKSLPSLRLGWNSARVLDFFSFLPFIYLKWGASLSRQLAYCAYGQGRLLN